MLALRRNTGGESRQNDKCHWRDIFSWFGGVLLALLFISDAYLPKLPDTRGADPDLPVIRIHSDRKWPEPVVYNTHLPTITPAHITNADSLPSPAAAADASVKARETFAQLQPSDASQLKPSNPRKRESNLQRKRMIAKKSAALLAQRPQLVFFGISSW